MNSIYEKIIDYLNKNRVSTTEVADCLGKTGAIEGVKAINRGHYRAGRVKWIYTHEESNWELHEQIKDIAEQRIVFVEAFDCKNRAIFGELVSKYLLLYRQSKALVVLGNMRDASALIRENYPIWCGGFNPVGCFNNKPKKDLDAEIVEKHYDMYEDSIAVCDDCGVVLISKEHINESFLIKLRNIEDQEDIWFDRLDHYKENTFDIVCQKKYLEDDFYTKRKVQMEV